MGWDPAARQHGGIRPEAACRERMQQDPACPKGAAPRSRRAPVHRQGGRCGIPPRLCCTTATARGGGGTPRRGGQRGLRRWHRHARAHPRLVPARRAARGDGVLETGALLQQRQTHRALTAALRLQTQPRGGPCPSCLRRAAPGPRVGEWGPAPGWGLGIGRRASAAWRRSGNGHARAAGPKHRLGGSWGGSGAPLPGVSVPFPLPRWAWPAWPLPKAAAAARDTAGSLPCWESSGLGPGRTQVPPDHSNEMRQLPRDKAKGWSTARGAGPAHKVPQKHLWSARNMSRETHYVLGSVIIVRRDG